MIVMEKGTAAVVLAAMKKTAPRGSPKGLPEVEIESGRTGLKVRWVTPEVAVEYALSGRRTCGKVRIPCEALAQINGREGTVAFEEAHGGTVVSWEVAGVPRACEYDSKSAELLMPDLARKFVPQPVWFTTAFADAVLFVGEQGRYALHRVQLSGRRGELTATDGRALLIQGGVSAPGSDDLLIPATRKPSPMVRTISIGAGAVSTRSSCSSRATPSR